jgi:hypothetical protein
LLIRGNEWRRREAERGDEISLSVVEVRFLSDKGRGNVGNQARWVAAEVLASFIGPGGEAKGWGSDHHQQVVGDLHGDRYRKGKQWVRVPLNV